jgi:hypothetical protein
MDSSSLRTKLFSGPMLAGVFLLFLIVGAIVMYMRRGNFKFPFMESFENENDTCAGFDNNMASDTDPMAAEESHNETNQRLHEDEESQVNPVGNSTPKDCFPHKLLDSKDLLPSEANSKWAQTNPAGQGNLSDKNFLNAGFHVGMNTVGQSLRNSNLQLRSEPPNPQNKVSPWLQSTIDPDLNRKPLEIGHDE